MTLSFPVDLATLFEPIGRVSTTLDAPSILESGQTAGGGLWRSELAAPLWRGSVTVRPYRHGDADGWQALLERLAEADATFFVGQGTRIGPRSNPYGTALDGFTPVIGALSGTSARLMSLNGLPGGFKLRAGDLISWTVPGTPTRYAFHRLREDATASAGAIGSTPLFEVGPMIRPGTTTGITVRLVRPRCLAVLTAYTPFAHDPAVATGGQFEWVQVRP